MEMVLETENLTKVFRHGMAVNRIDLSVPPGSVFGIAGANGAGKTTLLRMLVGLTRPTSGHVAWFGRRMDGRSPDVLERVPYVSADAAAYPDFRIRDVIHFMSRLYPQWDQQRADFLVDALALPRDMRVRHLSLGTGVQLRFAMALAVRPRVLVLDEPTNGLDPVVKHQLLQLLIQEAASEGTTILFATHQLEDVERLADHVVFMCGGRMVESGALEDVKQRIRGVRVVANHALPETLFEQPNVHGLRKRDHSYSCIVEGDAGDYKQRLMDSGAAHVDVFDLTMEELFRHIMAREGYTREFIRLSESAAL